MGIGMLQAATGEQIVFADQSGNHALIGIALFALVVHDAGRAALGIWPKAGGVLGIKAWCINAEWNI